MNQETSTLQFHNFQPDQSSIEKHPGQKPPFEVFIFCVPSQITKLTPEHLNFMEYVANQGNKVLPITTQPFTDFQEFSPQIWSAVRDYFQNMVFLDLWYFPHKIGHYTEYKGGQPKVLITREPPPFIELSDQYGRNSVKTFTDQTIELLRYHQAAYTNYDPRDPMTYFGHQGIVLVRPGNYLIGDPASENLIDILKIPSENIIGSVSPIEIGYQLLAKKWRYDTETTPLHHLCGPDFFRNQEKVLEIFGEPGIIAVRSIMGRYLDQIQSEEIILKEIMLFFQREKINKPMTLLEVKAPHQTYIHTTQTTKFAQDANLIVFQEYFSNPQNTKNTTLYIDNR